MNFCHLKESWCTWTSDIIISCEISQIQTNAHIFSIMHIPYYIQYMNYLYKVYVKYMKNMYSNIVYYILYICECECRRDSTWKRGLMKGTSYKSQGTNVSHRNKVSLLNPSLGTMDMSYIWMKKNREGPVKGLRSKKAWNAWPRIMEAWWLSWTGHRIVRTGWHSVFTDFNRGEPVKLAVFTYAHPCRRGQSVEKELLGEFSGEVACQASLNCGETGRVWTTGLYFC